MVYVTLKQEPKFHQFSFEDMLFGVDEKDLEPEKNTYSTLTRSYINTPSRLKELLGCEKKIDILSRFNEKYENLINTENKASLYRSFKIPKRSGGLRQIDAPNEELMKALKELKGILEDDFKARYHTNAYAYIKGRNTKSAIEHHQANNSRWFLKLDFSNFFGNTTPEFVLKQLKMIYPFNEILKDGRGAEELMKALSLCFLNGGLPQGTPISPTLTNLMMIPVDFKISQYCNEKRLCYTRYADDMLISSRYSFMFTEVQDKIIEILKEFEAPFELNKKKTHYGSSAGQNWNLGLMLNKDNKITIGHKKKKIFKAILHKFITDWQCGIVWELNDVQVLQGQISYYRSIEQDAIDEIIKAYNSKFDIDVMATIKSILKK